MPRLRLRGAVGRGGALGRVGGGAVGRAVGRVGAVVGWLRERRLRLLLRVRRQLRLDHPDEELEGLLSAELCTPRLAVRARRLAEEAEAIVVHELGRQAGGREEGDSDRVLLARERQLLPRDRLCDRGVEAGVQRGEGGRREYSGKG